MLFETAIGCCGLAWGEDGITGVNLPEASEAATRRRMERRFPKSQATQPPPAAQRAIDDIVSLLNGEPSDLSGIVLDMNGVPDFECHVYEVARTIPPGETRTYGEIAALLGDPGAARAVGQALGRNPFPIVVPCHRVLAAGGRTGGFSANGGISTKMRILTIEQTQTTREALLFDHLPLAAKPSRR